MLSTLLGYLKLFKEVWEALKILIGLVERAKHEHANKEITDKTEQAGDVKAPEKDRHEATKDLEDAINKRS